MKHVFLPLGTLLLMLSAMVSFCSEDGRASIYIVDTSEEFSETEGACLVYSPVLETGIDRKILALARGPEGSTLLMVAFDRDTLHLDLAPVMEAQTAESKPVRFPAEGGTWSHDKAAVPVDLYVALFSNDDPNLARLGDYVDWLKEALEEKDKDTAMLHALAIKNRLSNLLRQRSVEDYRVSYGENLADFVRVAPAPKAATTRSGKDPLIVETPRVPKTAIPAVRRGLKTLDEEWAEDSRPITFGPASPGILVFPVTTPPSQ